MKKIAFLLMLNFISCEFATKFTNPMIDVVSQSDCTIKDISIRFVNEIERIENGETIVETGYVNHHTQIEKGESASLNLKESGELFGSIAFKCICEGKEFEHIEKFKEPYRSKRGLSIPKFYVNCDSDDEVKIVE